MMPQFLEHRDQAWSSAPTAGVRSYKWLKTHSSATERDREHQADNA
jgi:hypothetical protein